MSVETRGLRCLWKLQVVVSCPMQMLRMKFGPSVRAVSALPLTPLSSPGLDGYSLYVSCKVSNFYTHLRL